jgi:GT2 family glycosyltransferase
MVEAPRVSVVVLAYGTQPLLPSAVENALGSRGVEVDVVLVDNGGDSDVLGALRERDHVTIVSPGRNLGFAAGSNLGARHATGEYLAFVNGDVLLRPDTLTRLVSALTPTQGPDVGLATASVRLLDRPEVINSAGNPVHFLGLSWAGGLERPAVEFADPRLVTSASGAATVVRREVFADVGGFCEDMFTYVEDTDLSLRLWSRGLAVAYVPDAVALHDYEFSRNAGKFFLLERNRLFMVLTLFPGRLLALTAPLALAMELAVLAVALRDGWAMQKLRGWLWLLRHPGLVTRRRRREAAHRVLSTKEFAALLTSRFDPGIPGLSIPPAGQALLNGYWSFVRRLL